jgi:replicative DNA helicase
MSFDAESAVLGACLLDQQAYWRVADIVSAEDFAEAEHRSLFKAIAELRKGGVDADVVTIAERLPDLAALVINLSNNTPSAKNARAYAEIMAEAAQIRRVQLAGRQIATMDGKGALANAQRLLTSCARALIGSVRKIADVFKEVQVSITERSLLTDGLTGLATGFEELDEMTAGLQPADLIIVAARPSVGKTALLVQISTVNARVKKRVLIFSIEMSARSLTERFLSHIGQIDGMHIRRPSRMTDDESKRMWTANEQFESLPIFIDDKVRTLESICAISHQQYATEGVDLIGIDYLQLMDMPDAETTNEALQEVTRGLKRLAKDLNVPVIALSQLTREGDERPKLSHLRGSGSIEQDADLAMLMSRPDKKRRDIVLVDLAKQRNGPTGDVYLENDPARNTFKDSDYVPQSKKPSPKNGLDAEPPYGGHRE